MNEMSHADMEAMREVVVEAANSLSARVLNNTHLKWRPGSKAKYKEMLKAAKQSLGGELDAFEEKHGRTEPPKSTWSGARPTTARGPVTAGGHRGASFVKAEPRRGPASGIQMGTHRAKQGGFWKAFKKGGDGMARASVRELIMTGIEESITLAMTDSSKFDPTYETGYNGEPSPVQQEIITEITQILKSGGILDAVAVEGGAEIATEILGCMPLLGAITNLGKGATNGIKGAMRWYDANKVGKVSAKLIAPGQPMQSVDAVQRLIERKRTQYMIMSGTNLTAGGAQTAGLFVDLGAATGPAIGISKAAVTLIQVLFLVIRDYREYTKANKLLRQRVFDNETILEAAPILGTYLITEAETSTLLAMMANGQLEGQWMDRVEKERRRMEYLYEQANRCQREAPFILVGYTRTGSRFKGEHFLDQRIHKAPQRIMWEIDLMLRRDPSALKSSSGRAHALKEKLKSAFKR
ncbi:hypothetical protein [Roseibium sp.]|uniref:hypothetical protein n=1 Tax=Roseibium sp. TaxID=1936156 RepID=UPI003BA9C37D